jgi:hypothetical protein
MSGREERTGRRSFLRSAALAGIATTTGCSARFGDYYVSVDRREGTEGGQPPSTPNEPPTPTPTRSPTSTPDIVEVEPDIDVMVDVSPTEDGTESGTATPRSRKYKIHDIKLYVAQAADAALNKPNTVELFGYLSVESDLTEEQAAWQLEDHRAIEIAEGERKALAVTPTYFDVSDSPNPSTKVTVAGILGEHDKGANEHDKLGGGKTRLTLNDLPGSFRYGPFSDSSDIEVYFEFSISRA